ncbi:endonuclease/exonuclease/phosphatase family protein [Caulobacter mirabilis]|uniref:Endonuclease n=1 Tax=Caulobacter mirabilis TaxID=69666 RepID=A0A2D2B0Y0_9CAUL|nr:endonuclease/exonuclease/phosphatase family protein [Caulobacter mirabilis]ATQ43905.1 endonuclease [Caulobacter mirabilis]
MLRLTLRLATALLAARGSTAFAQAPAEITRVMSYNIRYDNPDDRPDWPARRPHLIAQIRFLAPDILGVQEALPHMVEQMTSALPGYESYGLGRDDGRSGETTTIFYNRARFFRLSAATQWCSPTPDRPGKAYDAALPRTVTRVVLRDRLTRQVWDVRNVHFDHAGPVAREACARQVVATKAFPNAKILVLGDLNAAPNSAPYRALSGRADGFELKDARRSALTAFGPSATFNAFSLERRGEPIDYIFVDAAIDVLRFATLTDNIYGQVISDHYPIVADLRPPPAH